MKRAIDEIDAHPAGRRLMARAQERGARTLRRYTRRMSGDTELPAGASFRRRGENSNIELFDLFFAYGSTPDQFSGKPGYLIVSQILLHECLHALNDVSMRTEFAEMAGFIHAAGKWRFAALTAEDALTFRRLADDQKRAEQTGDKISLAHASRRRARQMNPVRVPTMRATTSPSEAFAVKSGSTRG